MPDAAVFKFKVGKKSIIYLIFNLIDHGAVVVGHQDAHGFERSPQGLNGFYGSTNCADAVKKVDAQVDGNTSARAQFALTPGRSRCYEVWTRIAKSNDAAIEHLYIANQALFYCPSAGPGRGIEIHVFVNAQNLSGFIGDFAHFLSCFDRDRHWFFDRDVFAGSHGVDGDAVMVVVSGQNDYGVDFALFQHFVVVGVHFGIAVGMQVTDKRMRRIERIARRIHRCWTRTGTLASFAEAMGVFFFARTQSRDLKEIAETVFLQNFIAAQMGVQYARTPDDTDSHFHGENSFFWRNQSCHTTSNCTTFSVVVVPSLFHQYWYSMPTKSFLPSPFIALLTS